MAKATRHDAVTETQVVEVVPEKVVLELSIDEAETLAVILGRIGGPTAGVRRYLEAIDLALLELGFKGWVLEKAARFQIEDNNRAIYFKRIGAES